MKISKIKFYQSLKCNSQLPNEKSEYSYIDCSTHPYEIKYDDYLIIVSHKESKEKTFTGMNNVVFFNIYE